jgi:hypothetical protein
MARTKGATAEKWWSDAIRLAVNRDQDDEGKKRKRISIIADKLCKMAIDGDMQAIKEIGDRLEGRPRQAVEHSGAGENGEIIFKTVYESK